jgi:putative redox protein
LIKLAWQKDLQFAVEDDHDHRMIIDTAKDLGGLDQGFRPAELVLVALAGCMGMDIVAILRKKGGRIERFEIAVEGERQKEYPRAYNRIILKIRCEGDYKREDLLRSFELSRDKYCSVYATLKSAPIIEFEI